MSDGEHPGVALIEPVGGHGGMNFYDFALAGALSALGTRTVVYTCDETDIPAAAGFGVETVFRRIYGEAPRLSRALRFVRGLIASLASARRHGLAVAHYHFFNSGPMELLSVVFARIAGFRVVVTAHDVTSFAGEGSHALGRRIYAAAHAIIAHNRASADELVTALGLPMGRIDIISSGNYREVAGDAPPRQAARQRLGLDPGGRVVLFFGQIKEVKGLDLLLRAWPGVRQGRPGALLLVAGKVWKDDFSRYAGLIERGGIGDSVRLDIRFIPDDQVADYYAAADLLVLPYRKIYQSAVLLMALSHGRAVLVSDLPGMTDIVTHGEDGYVFASGDADQLGARIAELLDDDGLRSRLEQGALRLMEEDYSWQRVASRTRDVYRTVTAQ